jgi:AraC-like DNA-binding protein
MSRKRQHALARSTNVRAYIVTLPNDYTSPVHWHAWDQLTYAAAGTLRVHGDGVSWLVPSGRAVWIPVRARHAEQLYGPAAMTTLYFAPRLVRLLPRRCAIVEVSPLLRELIVHASRLGTLDRKIAAHARLISVLIDQLTVASDRSLQLLAPRDPRALRVAAALRDRPDTGASVGALARDAGASRRTIERLFVAETQMTVGEWRRQLRLLHGVRLLASGGAVVDVAVDAGYSSASAFIAAFKKQFGTTPGKWG